VLVDKKPAVAEKPLSVVVPVKKTVAVEMGNQQQKMYHHHHHHHHHAGRQVPKEQQHPVGIVDDESIVLDYDEDLAGGGSTPNTMMSAQISEVKIPLDTDDEDDDEDAGECCVFK